jgi:hypothetical protein
MATPFDIGGPATALRLYLILICCAARGETVTYEELAQRAHQQDKGLLTAPLDIVAGWCQANGLPSLTLLLVETVAGEPAPASTRPTREQSQPSRTESASMIGFRFFRLALPSSPRRSKSASHKNVREDGCREAECFRLCAWRMRTERQAGIGPISIRTRRSSGTVLSDLSTRNSRRRTARSQRLRGQTRFIRRQRPTLRRVWARTASATGSTSLVVKLRPDELEPTPAFRWIGSGTKAHSRTFTI